MKKHHERESSLLTIVLDASPLAWGERDIQRAAQDKHRLAAGKRSAGPATLDEVLNSTVAFASSFTCVEKDCGIVVIGVADNETAILYPRKDELMDWIANPETYITDLARLRQDVTTGVADLIDKATVTAKSVSNPSSRLAAMSAALSIALCTINRLLVAAQAGGYTALHSQSFLYRKEDQGMILALADQHHHSSTSRGRRHSSAVWTPRIMIIQASEDRSRDYNAFMNCAFAAAKQQIVVDGCFLSSGVSSHESSSSFLEQICDVTGGVFLSPTGAAQVGAPLTEVLLSVFLSSLSSRPQLNLPGLSKVDFRARCFETGAIVDMAYTCNICLSIFAKKPSGSVCPTCQSLIISTNGQHDHKS